MDDKRVEAGNIQAPTSLTRRKLVKWGVVAGAVRITGSYALLSPTDKVSDTHTNSIQYWDTSEYYLLKRLVKVMLPTDGASLMAASKIQVIDNLDRLFGEKRNPHVFDELKDVFKIVDYGTTVLGGHLKRFVYQYGLPITQAKDGTRIYY